MCFEFGGPWESEKNPDNRGHYDNVFLIYKFIGTR